MEGRLFEERRLFQISCSREALNRRSALIRERVLTRSNPVYRESFFQDGDPRDQL